MPVLIIKCNKLILNELEKDEFLKIKPLEKNKEISINLKNRIYSSSPFDEDNSIIIIEIKKEEYDGNFIELNEKIKEEIYNNDYENLDYFKEKVYTIKYRENKLLILYELFQNLFNDTVYSFYLWIKIEYKIKTLLKFILCVI